MLLDELSKCANVRVDVSYLRVKVYGKEKVLLALLLLKRGVR